MRCPCYKSLINFDNLVIEADVKRVVGVERCHQADWNLSVKENQKGIFLSLFLSKELERISVKPICTPREMPGWVAAGSETLWQRWQARSNNGVWKVVRRGLRSPLLQDLNKSPICWETMLWLWSWWKIWLGRRTLLKELKKLLLLIIHRLFLHWWLMWDWLSLAAAVRRRESWKIPDWIFKEQRWWWKVDHQVLVTWFLQWRQRPADEYNFGVSHCTCDLWGCSPIRLLRLERRWSWRNRVAVWGRTLLLECWWGTVTTSNAAFNHGEGYGSHVSRYFLACLGCSSDRRPGFCHCVSIRWWESKCQTILCWCG